MGKHMRSHRRAHLGSIRTGFELGMGNGTSPMGRGDEGLGTFDATVRAARKQAQSLGPHVRTQVNRVTVETVARVTKQTTVSSRLTLRAHDRQPESSPMSPVGAVHTVYALRGERTGRF